MKTKDDMPLESADLARDLGMSAKQLAAITKKHGADGALERLQKLWLQRIPDRPRLLARDSSHGYVSEPAVALSEEPEAVPAPVQEEITAEAHRRAELAAAQAQAVRAQLPFDQRYLEVRAVARRLRIDVSGDVRVIEQRMAKERRRLAS